MSRSSTKKNPVIVRESASIGASSAEADDDFLFNCFVHHPCLDDLRNPESRIMVLAGRTGSGKTALLRHIEKTQEHVSFVDPLDLSMGYIVNSDVLRFFDNIGADLDIFFKILWKHVLLIEFIRLRYAVKDSAKSRSTMDRFREVFNRNDQRKKAMEYLENWENQFWITMDENVKSLTEKLEQKLNVEIGPEIAKLKAKAGYEHHISKEKKGDIVRRVQQIISTNQLAELNHVLDLLQDDRVNSKGGVYYILIDKLDERWVDESIRFKLIRALIESLKSFRKIRNCKIVVALRSDNLERTNIENVDLSYQKEKYSDYIYELYWNKKQIKELLDKRISYLYKRKYTTENVLFDDVFSYEIKRESAFEFITERTLMRPRDVLSFVNECLRQSEGRPDVPPNALRDAEIRYSSQRLQALYDEWRSTFPTLKAVTEFLSGRAASFSFADLSAADLIAEVAFKIAGDKKIDFDPLFDPAKKVFDGDKPTAHLDFARLMVATLYRVGAIGIKYNKESRFIWVHNDHEEVVTSSIGGETMIRVHLMLHRALNIHQGRA